MIGDIEQAWGMAPGWFASLDRGTQLNLFARFRILGR
jgi:hypothetical protein